MALRDVLVILVAVLVVTAAVKFSNLQVPLLYEAPASQEVETSQVPSSVEQSANNLSQQISPSVFSNISTLGEYALDENNTEFAIVDYVAAVCGDEICNVNEDCNSCSDCACSASERCSDAGVCLARESCGDGVCTSVENSTRSCCTDCGCGQGTLCNENVPACLPIVQLSNATLNQSIAAALSLPEFRNYTFDSSYDDYYQDKVVKVVVLRCPGNPDFDCEGYVYLNSQGQVVGTSHTT